MIFGGGFGVLGLLHPRTWSPTLKNDFQRWILRTRPAAPWNSKSATKQWISVVDFESQARCTLGLKVRHQKLIFHGGFRVPGPMHHITRSPTRKKYFRWQISSTRPAAPWDSKSATKQWISAVDFESQASCTLGLEVRQRKLIFSAAFWVPGPLQSITCSPTPKKDFTGWISSPRPAAPSDLKSDAQKTYFGSRFRVSGQEACGAKQWHLHPPIKIYLQCFFKMLNYYLY